MIDIENAGNFTRAPGNIGAFARFSIIHNDPKNIGDKDIKMTTIGDDHPIDLPNLRPITRHIKPKIKVTAPLKSNASVLSVLLDCLFKNSVPSTSASTQNGILATKIHCHPKASTSNPAPNVPNNIPSAWLPAVNPMPRPLFSTGKTSATMAGETAYRHPVPNACNILKPTTDSKFGDNEIHIIDNRYAPDPNMYTVLKPNLSEKLPAPITSDALVAMKTTITH